jgi:hypothetical protein
MNLKYGLIPAERPPDLRYSSYFLPHFLPSIPTYFGHQDVYPKDGWGMLKNGGHGAIGDCAVAGPMHCVMLWNKVASKHVRFTDADASEDYFALTGGDDTGVDMVTAASYWHKTGFRDSKNQRHKIFVYLGVDPKNLEHVYSAAYLFGAVGLGIQVPSSAERQFIDGHPWTNVPGDKILGYHYVPLVGRVANGNAVVITWGRAQEVEQSWLGTNLRECVAMISQEFLIEGKSPEGFDWAALQDDLAYL